MVSLTYDEIANYIQLNYDPDDYTDIDDLIEDVSLDFSIPKSQARDFAEEFWNIWIDEEEEIEKLEEEFFDEEEEIEEEKLSSTLEKIKQIMKEKLTKREQTKQVIETTSKSFTVKEFVELTGMNYNTARRELGQGVKNGQFERISRGIYRRL